MGSVDPVETDIVKLLAQNYGEEVGKFFFDTNTGEIFPIFLHNAFLVLKELMGAIKAREQLDLILIRHSVVQKYE
jgi:hypothetical protein